MTALTTPTTSSPTPAAAPGAPASPGPQHRTFDPIPFGRVVGVELRKMFDTRSGFWLVASIGILSVVATVAVVAFAPGDPVFSDYASAVGIPMAVLLPVIAILSVSSEWSQRTGLATFTFVPHRSRVIAAKAVCSAAIGVASMLVALGIGALGNVVGPLLLDSPRTWNVSVGEFSMIVLANVLGMFVGFMLGVLLRNSAAAVVGYFVYGFVLPGVFGLLAASQQWFADHQPWLDFNDAQAVLFDAVPTATQWTQLAVSGLFWLLIPLAVGLRQVVRSEVK